MVSFYDHSRSVAMGELGQYGDPQQMVAALKPLCVKERAAAYTEASPAVISYQ